MKILIKEHEGFKIYFEALDEHLTLADLLPDDTEEQLKEVDENNIVFCAKVTATKEGIELADDYLGGCIHESEEDFYTTKGCYFDDMVNTVVTEAKETIKKLTKQIAITEETAKELALICSIIVSEDIMGGTIFQTFDEIFEIAKKFLEKYPLETKWGTGESLLEYDEEIIQFVKNFKTKEAQNEISKNNN